MTLAPALDRWVNPIWQKSARSRLRVRHLASWGIVTVTVTAFVSTIIYTTMTEREMATPEVAAKAVLPGIIVIQAVLLMMFGTGAVAAGISQEREGGLLEYQRMTPMRPSSKILGYLFGLPVREYALFAMTLPFVGAAVLVSGFSLVTLAHFYVVFFTSIWVYHMTGMVAGMVAPKPRLASMLSIGLVAILYFVLPNLSRVGITFFEFLTIRPTFFGLLQQELPAHMRAPAEATGIDSFRDVPLFGGALHPTLYTLLVQGFLLVTMFAIAHRKWRNQAFHVLSKAGAFAVYCGTVFFVLGSVWALVVQDHVYRRIFESFDGGLPFGPRSPESLELLLGLSMAIVGTAFIVLITAVTPSRDTTVEGWRRARKLGRSRLWANSDAASSFPLAVAMIVVALLAGWLLLRRVESLGEYYESGPQARSLIVLALAVVGPALFVQGLRESMGVRLFGVIVFLCWMVPFFSMMIMYSAFEAWIAGSYVGLPCPPVLQVYSLGEAMGSAEMLPGVRGEFLPRQVEPHAGMITAVGAAGYAGAAILAQVARVRTRRRLHAVGWFTSPAGPNSVRRTAG